MSLGDFESDKFETHGRGELVDNKNLNIAAFLREFPQGKLCVWDALERKLHYLALNSEKQVCYVDDSRGGASLRILDSRLPRFFLIPECIDLLDCFLEERAGKREMIEVRGNIRTGFSGYTNNDGPSMILSDKSDVARSPEAERQGRLKDVLDILYPLDRKFRVYRTAAGLLIQCVYDASADSSSVAKKLTAMGYKVDWNDVMLKVEADFSADEENEARRSYKFAVTY